MDLLVAVDGSEQSVAALDHALDLAEAAGAAVTVVHAVEPSVYDEGGSEPIRGLADADDRIVIENVADAEERGEDVLDRARQRAEERGITVRDETLYGNPIQVVPRYAEENGIDGIFVGHVGRSERVEAMIGSVAKTLVERSPVPVTVVR
jgi:nucleotide-binding universal stress UspA family protein